MEDSASLLKAKQKLQEAEETIKEQQHQLIELKFDVDNLRQQKTDLHKNEDQLRIQHHAELDRLKTRLEEQASEASAGL